MKKNVQTLAIFCFSVFFLHAQNDCDKNLEKAKHLLHNPSPFGDQKNLFSLIEPCALQGNAEAENYLGMFYLNGIGADKDMAKAYTYMSSAANKGYAQAQYNLGRLYKYGMGCNLSFTKAIGWFEKATENGNQRAAYSLGYMYYKGYGVDQDYQKAVYWFERSNDAMAKHFLGICYYLGYGVTVDENKAIEILASNLSVNSKTMLTYIRAGQQQKIKQAVAIELVAADEETEVESIKSSDITEVRNNIKEAIALEQEELLGNWNGKLVQYDWSGESILRILPIEAMIKKSGSNLNIELLIEGKKYNSNAEWSYEQLYVNDIAFNLKKLYSSHPTELTLDYSIISIGLKQFEGEATNYIIGNVDTYISSWSEYGSPMSVILKPIAAKTNEDEEMLLALASQENNFIKLYPVPFNQQLTLQYTLETAGEVYVELIHYSGYTKMEISPKKWQNPGTYIHTINTQLQEGIYVARVLVGNQVHTRMVIKEN